MIDGGGGGADTCMRERAVAGWLTSDSASIERSLAVIDFTYLLYERIFTTSHRPSMTVCSYL